MEPSSIRPSAGAALVLSLLLAACTSSPGGSASAGRAGSAEDESRQNASAQQPEAEVTVRRTEEEVSGGNVEITTEPREAMLSIDGTEIGYTPLTLSLERGYYRLEAEKELYYPVKRWIDIREPEKLTEIDIVMAARNGILDPVLVPAESSLSIGGSPLQSLPASLPAGSYTLRAECFGYRPLEQRVEIRAGETISPRLELSPAPLRLEGLRALPSAVNPLDPGSLGTVSFPFRLSGPAAVEAEVLSPEGETVFSSSYRAEEGPRQVIRWQPCNGAAALPEGSYRLQLRAESTAAAEEDSTETSFRIYPAPRASLRAGLAGGFSGGTLLCPTAILPAAGVGHLSLSSLAGPFSVGDGQAERFPQLLTASWTVTDRHHLAGSGGLILRDGKAPRPSASLAYTGSLGLSRLSPAAPGSPVSAALNARYAYRPADEGLPGLYDGAAAGGTLSLHSSLRHPLLLSLTLAPELLIGPAGGGIDGRGVLRAALALESPAWAAAVSAVLRSTAFGAGPAAEWPAALAGELRAALPGSPAVFTLLLLAEAGPERRSLYGGISAQYLLDFRPAAKGGS